MTDHDVEGKPPNMPIDFDHVLVKPRMAAHWAAPLLDDRERLRRDQVVDMGVGVPLMAELGISNRHCRDDRRCTNLRRTIYESYSGPLEHTIAFMKHNVHAGQLVLMLSVVFSCWCCWRWCSYT